jgi:hypothetical protein
VCESVVARRSEWDGTTLLSNLWLARHDMSSSRFQKIRSDVNAFFNEAAKNAGVSPYSLSLTPKSILCLRIPVYIGLFLFMDLAGRLLPYRASRVAATVGMFAFALTLRNSARFRDKMLAPKRKHWYRPGVSNYFAVLLGLVSVGAILGWL